MVLQTEETRRTGTRAAPAGEASGGRRPRRAWAGLAIAIAVLAILLTSGIWFRLRARTTLVAETAHGALPSVSVVLPKPESPSDELILPGNVQPFITSPIFARTNGYLRKWYVDIGARVTEGQLLAVIDAPEVDQQLDQALANLKTARANLALAEITKNRFQGLLDSHAVSQQEVDNAVGSYNADKAIVESNEANVKQLQALQSFEKVYAPFDGLVTARNTDVGDLIDAGSSGGVKTDLFHIAQDGRLRVYVEVPEEYSQAIKDGMTADLSLTEFPGRRFQGRLVRNADAINMTTRTLLVEVDVDNPGILLSGSYAEVDLKIPTQASTLLLPVNALIFRSEGLRVAIVRDGKVVLAAVTPGHDFGDQIEIVSGLAPDDQVIVDPPDSIVSGQEVRIVQATLPGNTAGGSPSPGGDSHQPNARP
jgi:RND family efflux transporter MFP subunit